MRPPAALALCVAMAMLASGAGAQGTREPVAQRGAEAKRDIGAKRDLEQLRERIEALKGELEQKESTRREARDALRDSERAISDANRELRNLEAAAGAARSELKSIESRRRELQQVIATQQTALGRLLLARYTAGPPDALRILLSGEDPNDAARKLYYLSRISAEAAKLITDFRNDVEELGRTQVAAREQAARIATLQVDSRRAREKLSTEQRERRRVMERVAGDIRTSRREMKVLLADEARLGRVIEEISRLLSARPGAGYAPEKARATRRAEPVPRAAPGAARPEAAPSSPSTPSTLPPSLSGPFSALRGKLRLPVRGELLARFGSQQQVGNGTSKGVFIRSGEGQPVRSVADGRVVYADWMRGFGNLLIVDHGEAFLSVYGNNESLLKQPGDNVAGGEPIATVGSTGGNPESGLYFELRHLGKPFDPMRWISR